MKSIELILDDYFCNHKQFDYWNKVATLKEEYRKKVFFDIEGKEEKLEKNEVLHILNKMLAKLEEGIKKSKDWGKGLYPTYFTYDLVDYEEENGIIIPKSFNLRTLPLFLEGPTRAFKTIEFSERKEIYDFIRNSNIYDKKLAMYKTSESIMNEPHNIGRLRAFTPGWLENESVFMHMEFKYLLALLQGGLYEEYFESIKTAFPPFLNYETYGRSILENSSFIVSSANKNENLHGQGFSARLSGSTAEFLSMWKLMFVGAKLFSYENNELNFTFDPIISNEFFDENGELSFRLFSNVDIKYVNKDKLSTFGGNKGTIKKMIVSYEGKELEAEGNKLVGVYANLLRNKKIEKITCYIAK